MSLRDAKSYDNTLRVCEPGVPCREHRDTHPLGDPTEVHGDVASCVPYSDYDHRLVLVASVVPVLQRVDNSSLEHVLSVESRSVRFPVMSVGDHHGVEIFSRHVPTRPILHFDGPSAGVVVIGSRSHADDLVVKPNVTSHVEVVRVQLHVALHLGVVRVVGEVPRHGKVAEGRQLLAGVRRRCLRHAALAGRHVVPVEPQASDVRRLFKADRRQVFVEASFDGGDAAGSSPDYGYRLHDNRDRGSCKKTKYFR